MKITKTKTVYIPAFGFKGSNRIAVMVVLTEDLTGQQAAYMGAVPESVGGDALKYDEKANHVASGGTKLTYRDAKPHFSGLDESKYRL